MIASNPAAIRIDSSTRFRVKTWRGMRIEGAQLQQGEEFPRRNHNEREIVALMTMGMIEPIQIESVAAVERFSDDEPPMSDAGEEAADDTPKPLEAIPVKRGRGRPRKSAA